MIRFTLRYLTPMKEANFLGLQLGCLGVRLRDTSLTQPEHSHVLSCCQRNVLEHDMMKRLLICFPTLLTESRAARKDCTARHVYRNFVVMKCLGNERYRSRLALFKWPNRVDSPPAHLVMEREPFSGQLCFLVFRIPDDGQSSQIQKFWVLYTNVKIFDILINTGYYVNIMIYESKKCMKT
jgi:hypothetical protein